MASFQIAHINERGSDVIILPLAATFRDKSPEEQKKMLDGIKQCVRKAGLRGDLVPVWPEGDNIGFIAPKPWHPFCQSLTWDWIRYNINRELTV